MSEDFIQLTLVLNSYEVSVSEYLEGEVRLHLQTDLVFHSIRLILSGKEDVSYETGTKLVQRTNYLLKSFHTFVGSLKGVDEAEKEVIEYEKGYYTFPFRVKLDPVLPPSCVAITDESCVCIRYRARAEVELLGEEKITDTLYFRLRSALNAELNSPSSRGQIVKLGGKPFKHSALGCYCCAEEGELSVNLSVVPGVWNLYKTVEDCLKGAVNQRPLVVVMRVKNMTKITIKDFRVVIKNIICVPLDNVHRSVKVIEVGRGYVDDCPVEPGTTGEIVIESELNIRGYSIDKSHYTMPLPTFRTTALLSFYVVEVKFPGVNVEGNFTALFPVELTEMICDNDTALPGSRLFASPLFVNERYIGVPRRVRIPDEEKVFPTERQPYLPRTTGALPTHRYLEDSEDDNLATSIRTNTHEPFSDSRSEVVTATVVNSRPDEVIEGYIERVLTNGGQW